MENIIVTFPAIDFYKHEEWTLNNFACSDIVSGITGNLRKPKCQSLFICKIHLHACAFGVNYSFVSQPYECHFCSQWWDNFRDARLDFVWRESWQNQRNSNLIILLWFAFSIYLWFTNNGSTNIKHFNSIKFHT